MSKTTERLREEKMKSRELARSPRGLRHSDLDLQDDYGKGEELLYILFNVTNTDLPTPSYIDLSVLFSSLDGI